METGKSLAFKKTSTATRAINEPVSSVRDKLAFVYREDSNQSAHPYSLISVLVFRLKKTLGHWLHIERTSKTDQTARLRRLILRLR